MTLKQFKRYTGLGGSTRRLHHTPLRVDTPTFLCIGHGLTRVQVVCLRWGRTRIDW